MCNPGLALGIGLMGGLLQGIGDAQQREVNAQTYDLKAAGITRDIAAEQESTAYTIAAKRVEIAKTQGSARAGFSANGLALSGSAADVLRDSALEGDLDVAAIRWNSDTKVAGMQFERSVYKHNAGQERAAKGLAFVTPIISGAARFSGGF